MAQLIISPGTPQARPVVLREGVNRVGRSDANDITVPEGSVSGAHCEVIVANGTVRIRDLGSTNGTFVNGAQVSDAVIEPGQRIQLGSAQLLFEAGSATNTASAVTPAVQVPSSPPRPIAVALSPARTQVQENLAATASAKPAVRLRVAREGEAPPAEAPAVAVETELVEREPATATTPTFNVPLNARCKYHPASPARWVCTGCQKTYCDLCVTPRAGQHFCRSCAAVCAPLEVAIEVAKEQGFFSELPRAVLYPFRGKGIMVLIVATIVFAGLDFMSRGIAIFAKMIAIGYLFAYVQNIIHSTAAGDDGLPELPAMDGLFGNFFRLAGTVLMAFGPALVAAYFAIWQEQPAWGIALVPTIVFGCLYFPMAFLAVAMKDNVLASNPLVVVPSIVRVPVEYIVATILIAGVFAVRWAGDALSGSLGQQALTTRDMSEMFLLFGFRLIWAFLSVYLLTVTMRILGLLYVTKRDRLGW